MIPLDVLPLPLVDQTKWCAIPQQRPLTTHVPQLDGVKICLVSLQFRFTIHIWITFLRTWFHSSRWSTRQEMPRCMSHWACDMPRRRGPMPSRLQSWWLPYAYDLLWRSRKLPNDSWPTRLPSNHLCIRMKMTLGIKERSRRNTTTEK